VKPTYRSVDVVEVGLVPAAFHGRSVIWVPPRTEKAVGALTHGIRLPVHACSSARTARVRDAVWDERILSDRAVLRASDVPVALTYDEGIRRPCSRDASVLGLKVVHVAAMGRIVRELGAVVVVVRRTRGEQRRIHRLDAGARSGSCLGLLAVRYSKE